MYLRRVGDPAERLEHAVTRARAFLEAGADGIFVPGVVAPDAVAALVCAVPGPLNVLVGPGAPTVSELAGLGVARISLGPGLAEVAYAALGRAAEEFRTEGTYGGLVGGLEYGELNGLFTH